MSTSYLYNGIGQRVSKHGPVVQSGTNYFVYDEQGHVLGEYGLRGAPLQETVYLGTRQSWCFLATSYVSTDHLDTPRLISRSADNVIVWRWDATDPFGVPLPHENPSGLGAHTYNMRFPGQLFEAETNNHYNYHRNCDPQTGRYVQSDPIGLNGGINTNTYVGGNPLSLSDPGGQAPSGAQIGGAIGGAVGSLHRRNTTKNAGAVETWVTNKRKLTLGKMQEVVET